MPEERKEDADASIAGEEEGEEEIPSDIMPLFFTSKTQEIFGCKGDEDVTEENPHKLIPKEAIIQDFKDRAAVSDFHPAKQIVLDYAADQLLVVYDPMFKYGQNFYLALTEEAKERLLNPPQDEAQDGEAEEGDGEDLILTLRKFPRTPQPWQSLGSEVEVEEENVIENRPKVKFRISRKRREFGVPVTFGDRNVSDAKDGFVECPSFEDDGFSLLKKELDKGIQAVPVLTDNGNQTEWRKPRNAVTQYSARTLEEKSKDDIKRATTDIISFIEKVTPRFELALQQNEILDVFYDDYLSLADDETTFGAKSDNYLKEYQSFTDLQYSKEKTITDIQWHPVIKGIIAVSCGEGLSFDDRVDNFSRILMTSSLVLIWSFSDPIHPLALLEAPDDIFSFKFNPSDPNIIAGGCINGQIVLWDITNHSERLRTHRQSHGQSKKNSMNSLPGFEDESSFDQSPILRYCAVSSIEHSHKTVVTDITWIPDHMEIGRMGVVVENKSQQCNQLMSCAADGTVLVWDTRPSKSAAPSQAVGHNPVGILPTFKHLDLTWKPVLRVTVSHSVGAGEFGPSVFSISERQGARTSGSKPSEEKETREISNLSTGLSKGRDHGKPLENVSSKFFIGTEEGDLVYMDWKPEKDTDSGKIVSPRPEQVWLAHDGPITTLQRSPFFRDILLTVGGWTFAIWKEGVTNGPLLQSASHLMRLTRGHWSPSRPGVFFITKTDGNVDVWDLLDRSHEPSLTQNVTAAPITTISPHQVSSKQQLLAVGDGMGTLHVMEVPWNLRHPSANEANAMENFFEREVKRLAFVEERMKIREQEKKQLDAEESKRQQEGKRAEESDADIEAKQRMEYQEYLQMEKQLLEELGIREESDDPIEV
ncbi:dynein axonemal intermediate chain 3-like [Pocillopora verrucosa]|uniref:dynein axonemal intermediate chain 3-like n=1 Tax=Pocillopora verrucosa TaxID=203993 RepID=UPI00279780EA|nr:dynein axonemal intermediate chain 3-like [Pocillopora verrucosa]